MASASAGSEGDQVDWKFPSWNGDWASFSDYVFRVELKADATKTEELVLLGPRLAGNLVGRAFEAISDVDRSQLKDPEGWRYLLRFLEQKRGKEKVDVLGDSFSDFFVKKDAQRKDGEELVDYELRFRTMVRRLDKAVRDSGSEGKIPQELYGWCLLHMYMRMDPSDIANVRGRADSYKLEHVLSALHRMWSGGGLALKDHEKKKKQNGHTLLVDEENTSESTPQEDGIYYDEEYYDEPSYELDEAAAWFHEVSIAFNETPDDPEIYASFQEARRALDKARVSRGFYPVRNPNQSQGKGGKSYGKHSYGKGKGKSNNTQGKGYGEDHSDKICMRCGKRGHIARNCPQKGAQQSNAHGGNSGKIGFVGTVYAVHETKEDYWEVNEEQGKLIRHHLCPRKHFFSPDLHECPVNLERLADTRVTTMKMPGLPEHEVQDVWQSEASNMMKSTAMWHGMTIFEIVEKKTKKVRFSDDSTTLIAVTRDLPETGMGEMHEPQKVEDPHTEDAVYVQSNEQPLRGKAIIDSGASDNIVGVETLQELAAVYEEMGFNAEEEIEVDRTMHKNFVFGNNQSSSALGLSHVNAGVCGSEVKVQAHVVEGGTPFLLSSKFLYDAKATINFRTGVGVFEAISPEHVQLERSPGNHLMIPVTSFAGHSVALNAMKVEQPDPSVQLLQENPEENAEPQGVRAGNSE